MTRNAAILLTGLLGAGLLAAAQPSFETFIAHRGESDDAPENTLPAYQRAVARGFGFECDVYLSADGRVFTCHDGNLARTSAGASTKTCAEASWETELSRLDVGGWGRWKGSKFSPTRPALLEEVLALAVDGRWIYVEVKPGPEIVPHIRDVFAKQTRARPQNTLFISFSKGSCAVLKRLMPGYKVFWLTGARRGRKGEAQSPITPAFVLDALRETGADGVDCQFDPDVVTADFVQAIRGAGFEFHVWTVDRLDRSLLAFARGAQTVTTNCAQRQLDAWRARRRK